MKYSDKVLAVVKNSKVILVTLMLSVISAYSFAVNPIDSDLTNSAGSNSGKSHLDIYLFIVSLLVLCVVIAYWEDRQKTKRTAK